MFVTEIDGMKMPFICDYKTDEDYRKAVCKWNDAIKEKFYEALASIGHPNPVFKEGA